MKDKKKLIEVKDTCFDYFKNNFIAWDYRFDDPWKKEIHKNEDEDQFSWKELGNLPPEDQGVYLFNSKTEFEYPYGTSGIYYIGKADSGLKTRLKGKLTADYDSQYDGKKHGKKDRYFNFNENVNHYYPYLNYYQKFTTTIWCKIIKKDMVPYVEEILISAFFTKMGNRPPSNRTGPNQLIWTDSENRKKLKTIYDDLLSSKSFF